MKNWMRSLLGAIAVPVMGGIMRIERGLQSSQDVFSVDVASRTDRAAAESLVAPAVAGHVQPPGAHFSP